MKATSTTIYKLNGVPKKSTEHLIPLRLGSERIAPSDISRKRAYRKLPWCSQGTVIDDGCWKLSLHTPNAHAGRVAQLIDEAERRRQMVERARGKAPWRVAQERAAERLN